MEDIVICRETFSLYEIECLTVQDYAAWLNLNYAVCFPAMKVLERFLSLVAA